MSGGQGIRRGLEGLALALCVACAGAPASARDSVPSARDSVRTIPLASAGPEIRNISDEKTIAVEPARTSSNIARDEMTVVVDRAKVIRLPERTQTVIIGNPAVADIAIQKSGVVILTGKSFGVTNVITLDASGTQLSEAMVSVSAPDDATLMVQRGMERQTYSCTPACQPSIALGDAGGYFAETKGQADQHTAAASAR